MIHRGMNGNPCVPVVEPNDDVHCKEAHELAVV